MTYNSKRGRLATFRNALYFARHGHWHSAALRFRCVLIGHRFHYEGALADCERCKWVELAPGFFFRQPPSSSRFTDPRKARA